MTLKKKIKRKERIKEKNTKGSLDQSLPVSDRMTVMI